MPEAKTKCSECDAEILETTAARTGGLCMPCKNGVPAFRRPDPNAPLEALCKIDSMVEPPPILITTAQQLLAALEKTTPIGDSRHPNRLELETQRALLRHAIRHRAVFRLNDDHWGRTKYAALALFEAGEAEMEIGDSCYRFKDLTKIDWQEVDGPLCGEGGFEYRNSEGVVIFKAMTWVS